MITLANINAQSWVNAMHRLPPEAIWGILLVACFASIILLLRLFGAIGLYVYMAIGVIAANIQVLKVVQFSLLPEPVALGTVIFSTIFLCTDILAEYYCAKTARNGVYLSMLGMFLMTLFMHITLGFRPLDPATAPEGLQWALPAHDNISAIFTPAPALFLAGVVSFLTSQLYDVWVFTAIRKLTRGRYLWLRNNVSTILSALIDSVLFSTLAWIVLAPHPLPWKTVLFTYILGTYWIRVIFAIIDTPIIYLARHFIPQKDPLLIANKLK